MASCTLFLGTYYGFRSGKFLKLVSKPITILLIIFLNYEKYYFYGFKKRGCCSEFNFRFTFKRGCDNFTLHLSVWVFTTVFEHWLYETQCNVVVFLYSSILIPSLGRDMS